MKIRLLFFAAMRDQIGCPEQEVDIPGDTVADVVQYISNQYPHLSALLPHMQIAVNEGYASRSQEIHPNDTIAFIPPVSGGTL